MFKRLLNFIRKHISTSLTERPICRENACEQKYKSAQPSECVTWKLAGLLLSVFMLGTILTKYMGFFQSRSKAIFCHTAEKMFFIYISLPGGPLNTFK